MRSEFVGMAAFRQLAESGGVSEFVVQQNGGAFFLFAVNHSVERVYFLQERRGGYKSWQTIDRAAAFLASLNVRQFTVRLEQPK